MDLAIFIYNVFLLVLYSVSLTLMCVCYSQTKKKIHLYVGILFFFYILDNLVIYMTEFLDTFSQFYDNIFMTVPTFKTIIFTATLSCMLLINFKILHLTTKQVLPFICSLVLIIILMLFVPMAPNSALKVWIYYFPCQAFTFALSLHGLAVIKQHPDLYSDVIGATFRKLLFYTAVFSVLIVIEDTIVIFNFDVYSDIMVKINNRSLSEDILSIYYCITVIRVFFPLLRIENKDRTAVPDIPSDQVENTAEPEEIKMPEETKTLEDEKTSIDKTYSKFYLFCRLYQLTTREQDILKLLLQDMNNEQISDELFISLGTTKSHIHNIFVKLEVNKRRQLIEKYEKFNEEDNSLEI